MPPTSGQRWVLALTSLGFFMAMMDSMIVTTASTAIRADFGATVGQLQWMLNAYNVAVAAFLLIGVALGARLGYRRMYVVGLIVFVVGSVVAALSPT
ncbi:MFS transporter, partial [Propionibacterium freudenreichii]